MKLPYFNRKATEQRAQAKADAERRVAIEAKMNYGQLEDIIKARRGKGSFMYRKHGKEGAFGKAEDFVAAYGLEKLTMQKLAIFLDAQMVYELDGTKPEGKTKRFYPDDPEARHIMSVMMHFHAQTPLIETSEDQKKMYDLGLQHYNQEITNEKLSEEIAAMVKKWLPRQADGRAARGG